MRHPLLRQDLNHSTFSFTVSSLDLPFPMLPRLKSNHAEQLNTGEGIEELRLVQAQKRQMHRDKSCLITLLSFLKTTMVVTEITVQSNRLRAFCVPKAEDELLKLWEHADLSWSRAINCSSTCGFLTERTKCGKHKLASPLQKAVRKGTKINLET